MGPRSGIDTLYRQPSLYVLCRKHSPLSLLYPFILTKENKKINNIRTHNALHPLPHPLPTAQILVFILMWWLVILDKASSLRQQQKPASAATLLSLAAMIPELAWVRGYPPRAFNGRTRACVNLFIATVPEKESLCSTALSERLAHLLRNPLTLPA